MTIKELIENFKEFSTEFKNGLDTEVCVGNTHGIGNYTFNQLFFRKEETVDDEEVLAVINSYYHYEIKYDCNGECVQSNHF